MNFDESTSEEVGQSTMPINVITVLNPNFNLFDDQIVQNSFKVRFNPRFTYMVTDLMNPNEMKTDDERVYSFIKQSNLWSTNAAHFLM